MDGQKQQYNEKLEELKNELPFLLRVLEKLRNNNLNDPGRLIQLEKMQKLYDLINDKTQILKWETLLKCETVVKKLQKKMEQQTEIEFRKTKFEKDETPTSPNKTSTSVNLDEIPVPESPPPQQDSDIEIIPIEIPTEWRNSPPNSPKNDRKTVDLEKVKNSKDHRKHNQHHHRHHSKSHLHGDHHSHQEHYHHAKSNSHESHQHHHYAKPNSYEDNHHHHRHRGSYSTFQSSISKEQSDYDNTRVYQRRDSKSINGNNKNKNTTDHDDVIYSPNEAWDRIQNKAKERTFSKGVSSNAPSRLDDSSSGSWPNQKQSSNIFSRLGQKVTESTRETLTIKIRNNQQSVKADEAVPPPPRISADLLKQPPLSANDITKLLIENNTNSNSNSNSNTFDYNFGKQSSTATAATSPSEPSTFDLIRKKFALLTKGNSSPSDKNLPSNSSACSSPLTSTLGDQKLKPQPLATNAKTMPGTGFVAAANLANVNVLPTLRPNDPRLRRAASILNSTASLPLQHNTSNEPALSSLLSSQIPTILSRKIVPTLPITKPLSSYTNAQPIQVFQQTHAGNLCPTLSSQKLPPHTRKTTTSVTSIATTPSLLIDLTQQGPCTSNAAFKNSSNNQNQKISSDPRIPFTRYCDSSDENWDTDDNACDYDTTIRTATSSSEDKAQSMSEFRSQSHNLNIPSITQRRNSTAAAPFMQRRNSISFKDANRLSGQQESQSKSCTVSSSRLGGFQATRQEDVQSFNKCSTENSTNLHLKQSIKHPLNTSDINETQRSSITSPPMRRKSISWELQTEHAQSYNKHYSNPAAIRHNNSNNSPMASNTSASNDRFNAKINDSVERLKYLESKKQKDKSPRTYGAYREAKARAAAEAEARKNSEAKLSAETEPPVINSSTSPAPIANTTLDNLYRNTNTTSSELPKAIIGSFKIPKKQTSVDDAKKQAEHVQKTGKVGEVDENLAKTKATAKCTQEKSKNVDRSKMQPTEKLEKSVTECKEDVTKEAHQDTMNVDKVENIGNVLTAIACKEKVQDKISRDANKTNKKPKSFIKAQHYDNKGKTETDKSQKPKPQRNRFKHKSTKSQHSNEKHIFDTNSARDPRLGKGIKQSAQENTTTTKKINDSIGEIKLKIESEECKNAEDESLKFNDTDCQNIDQIRRSDKEENSASTKATEQASVDGNEKITTPKKQFEELLNSPIKPRRILTRRCTMIDQASAPEVDKEKLSKANAMLFEDLQEQERKKKAAVEAAKAHSHSGRRYTGEICYDKTDDGCTVSTQNIISGKRRTRTTVNFNEVQQTIAVFKHLKLPETSAKSGSKPKPKSVKNESEETSTPLSKATTATKQIRKRRQTLIESDKQTVEPHAKQRKETVDNEEAAVLPHVTNIFDSFIQKILHPDTDAEELINKLRDILNESEVQTLLDVRATMSKKQTTQAATNETVTTTKIEAAKMATQTAEDEIEPSQKSTSTKCTLTKNVAKTNGITDIETSTVQQVAIAKSKHHKNELDRLHDDIRDMFISEGVLTATGRRVCTFVKPTTSKSKADSIVTPETTKATTAKNNEALNVNATPPARKTRIGGVTAAAKLPAAQTGRSLRKKPMPHAVNKEDSNNSTDISDLSSHADFSLLSTMSSSATNLDTTSNSGELIAELRDMPKLKPAKPIRLPEEDELEALMAKAKHVEAIKKHELTTTPSLSPTPSTKSATLKKRRKPCPKSKKPSTVSSDEDNESSDGDEDENMTLIKIKQEMLDITVPYKEPKHKSMQKSKQLKNKNDQKNINPKWHFQSRYAHACVLCQKRAPFISMHYKKFHCENYSSRLAPSILHQLKVDNTSMSRPILKFAPSKNKQSTYLWLHRCPFCLQYKRTLYKSWLEHFITHTGEHCYECTLCHSSCNKMTVIERHMKDRCLKMGGRYIHNDEIVLGAKATTVYAHICHLCNFLRLGRSSLERHYVEQHDCDVKEAKSLGYTIVLMDFDNVPFIDTLEEANEVEEKLSSQFNGLIVDLSSDKGDSESEEETRNNSKQQILKKRKTVIKTKQSEVESKYEVAENETTSKLHVKAKNENEGSQGKSLKKTIEAKTKQPLKVKDKQEEIIANGTTEETSSKVCEEAECNITKVPTSATTSSKVLVSNAFMSTTDCSNEEEAATSKLLVDTLFDSNNEVEVSTNFTLLKNSNSNALTMAERLSQRLREAEEKAISPTKDQQQHLEKPQSSPTLSCHTATTETAGEVTENETSTHDGPTEINEADEEEDGWEDIEIVESAPSANSSMASHTSSLSSRDSKTTHKSKMNAMQKFSRFLSAPNAIKSRKKNTKGLKSLMTLLSDNTPSQNENSVNSNDHKTQKITNTVNVEAKLQQTNDTITNAIETNQTEKSTTTNASQTLSSNITTTTSSTASNQTSDNSTLATINTSNSTSSLGFRPLIANLADLLPDSSSNDPLELVPELTPSGPLQDLNDLTSFLGENLNGIIDMDVDASSNSVCIHNIDNRETSIQDALDFVTSQTESYEMSPNNNSCSNVMPVSTSHVMNRVQNVGFNCTVLNEESTLNSTTSYKFYCLSDRCTFLFSSEAIGLENHFLFEHPQAKWNGYCEACAAQIKFETTTAEFSYTEEIKHLLQVHTKPMTPSPSNEKPQTTTTPQEEETSRDQAPRIKLRRLSGDCLSTTTANSNSSSNAATLSGLDDSNSFSDLIQFNPTRQITLSSDESQTALAPKAAQNASNEMPIEISCLSNDSTQPLFKNVSKDFQITSISSGLEPSELTEIVKNAYQKSANLSTNAQQITTSKPLQIASVVSLHETSINDHSNASESRIPQPKINVLPKRNNPIPSAIKTVQKNGRTAENATATTSTDSENTLAPLPKITNVCSLSSNSAQRRDKTLWAQQMILEPIDLSSSANQSPDAFNVQLINSELRNEHVNRTPTPPPKSSSLPTPHDTNRDSPEPLVVSETVPVAQATTGNFVITQTLSAQYNDDINAGSKHTAKPTLGFNISISAADMNAANITSSPVSVVPSLSTTSIDLTTDNEEQPQQQQPITMKLPPLKCLEHDCNFIARHFVAMISHLKMHDLINNSTECDYLKCSICTQKCSNVDDYSNHVRAKHLPSASTQKLSVASTTANAMMPTTQTDKATTALTEKIRNILNGKQGDVVTGAVTVSSSNNNKSLQNEEDVAFRAQLHETIKNMIAKTGIAESKLYRCLVNNCHAKLGEENFHTHTLYHLSTVGTSSNGPFSCPHCKTKYSTIPLLKKHLKSHLIHNFFCYICLETAPNAGMISQHYAEQHNFKKGLKSHELLKIESDNGVSSVIYYVAHSSPLSTENIHNFGKKLIIEWQRKKAATRTHFKPNEVDLLPMQAIFSRDIFCGVCQYKSKVRTNMLRHLLQHKADTSGMGAVANTAGGSQSLSGAASTSKRTFMDPVNPVPCLISNERHFDRMANLASSSFGSSGATNVTTATTTTNASSNSTPIEVVCKLRCSFVSETKRYICGVPGCQYLTISEDIFRAHLATLHSDARTYRCPLCSEVVCKKTFASERVIQHLRYHDRTLFQCNKCEYQHYIRYLVEKHVLEKHGHVSVAYIIAFVRDEQQPLEGFRSIITVSGKKSKESNPRESPTNNNANISPVANNERLVAAASTSTANLSRKQRTSVEMNTRPLWQRDDPKRIRQIRGIPMEDEADSERLKKRLRLSEDYYDDEEDGTEATPLLSETICKLYLNCFEFGCFHCETKTLNLQELRNHWQKTHNQANNCAVTKPFQFRLLKHLRCAECRNFFGCHWELRKHLTETHKKQTFFAADARTKQLVCGFCDYECTTALQLQRHTQRQDHAELDIKALTAMQMVQTMRLESSEDDLKTTSSPLVYVQCMLCNELFCSDHEVSKHAREKHIDDIDRFSFREYKNTILYRCLECAFASAEELIMLRHMINHYTRFKRCHFCAGPQATFNGYMQHCYSDHRSEIRRFSEIYPLNDIRKFLLQMLVLFPNGWIIEKRNLRDTPYGSEERIKQFYAEICKTSQEPPIPRLSLGRLVARKSIEARQQQHQQQIGEADSASTAAAMQLAGNANSLLKKQALTAKKISKRRSTVAIGNDNDMSGAMIKNQTFSSAMKRQKLSTHIVENRNKVMTLAPSTNIPMPPKFSDASESETLTHVTELKPYSFYGKRPEKEEPCKIFTNISFAGVNTRIPLDKFKILVQLDAYVLLEKLDFKKLCAAKNAATYQISEECEVGSSSGNSTNIVLPNNSYSHVAKACPASQKYRFT